MVKIEKFPCLLSVVSSFADDIRHDVCSCLICAKHLRCAIRRCSTGAALGIQVSGGCRHPGSYSPSGQATSRRLTLVALGPDTTGQPEPPVIARPRPRPPLS